MVKIEDEGSAGPAEMVGVTLDELARLGAPRRRFRRRILPPSMRRAPTVAEVWPILDLRGLSTGDVRAALPVRLGEDAAGLSPTTSTRLTAAWETAYQAMQQRDLRPCDDVYIWVDGIHFTIRLEDERLCTLVVIGARADGTKAVIAVEDGDRDLCHRVSGKVSKGRRVAGARSRQALHVL